MSEPRRRSVGPTGPVPAREPDIATRDVRPHRGPTPWQPTGFFLSPLLTVSALFFFVVVAITAYYGFGYTIPTPDASAAQGGPSLAIDLHPGLHVHRDPIIQHHHWRVTKGPRRPDGVKKNVYLVNDEFPGPTIEARTGDVLHIIVENLLLDNEGLAVHWHGLHMRGANEMDGAVGMTQCATPPGRNFTYTFNVSGQHGTYWWHSHDQVQRADGLFGGLVVHKPQEEGGRVEARLQESLFLIGDWYHRSAAEVLGWYMRARSFGNEPVPDGFLVNGMGRYDCQKAVPARPVDCIQDDLSFAPRVELSGAEGHRFRVVNTGTLAGLKISMPDASMTALEVDGGGGISGEPANSIGILYPGERVDFVVHRPSDLSKALSSEIIVALDHENFRYPNPAIVDTQSFPVAWSDSSEVVRNAPDDQPGDPYFDLSTANSTTGPLPQQEADLTFVLYTTSLKLAKAHNMPQGFINTTSWRPQSPPLLLLPRSGFDKNQLVPFIPLPDTGPLWVDIVLNNLDDGSHPFHLHGHDFYVLSACADGTYWGEWNPFDKSVDPPCGDFNTLSPQRRDTVVVPRRGYVVLRFLADNPGLHMFHCHILWHQASGMAMGFQVGGDEMAGVSADWDQVRVARVTDSCKESD